MIDPKQIPDEVVEAVLRSFPLVFSGPREARAAIAAAINAWPDSILMPAELILPLPQEKPND